MSLPRGAVDCLVVSEWNESPPKIMNTRNLIVTTKILKGRSGVYKEKLASVLALSVLHSSCEHLHWLVRFISNLIGLSYKM